MTTKMREFHSKHGGKATWAGATIAVCALVSTGIEQFDGKESALALADSRMKIAMAEEIAGLKEWKKATIKDLEQFEASIAKLQYELAVSATTLELMSKGQTHAAKAAATAVSESVSKPSPAKVEDIEDIEVKNRRVKLLPRPTKESVLKAAKEVIVEREQIQAQYKMFE